MKNNLVEKKNAKRFDKWVRKELLNNLSLSVMEKQERKNRANSR